MNNSNIGNKKIISAFAIDDGDFVENIINVCNTIVKTLEEYDEIDLSEASDSGCLVKSIKRSPLICITDNSVISDKILISEQTKGDYKIYIEKNKEDNK